MNSAPRSANTTASAASSWLMQASASLFVSRLGPPAMSLAVFYTKSEAVVVDALPQTHPHTQCPQLIVGLCACPTQHLSPTGNSDSPAVPIQHTIFSAPFQRHSWRAPAMCKRRDLLGPLVYGSLSGVHLNRQSLSMIHAVLHLRCCCCGRSLFSFARLDLSLDFRHRRSGRHLSSLIDMNIAKNMYIYMYISINRGIFAN